MSMTPTQRVEVLRASCCIAGADGETTPEEMELLKKLADDVGCGDASLNAMISRAEEDSEFYKQQFRVLKDEPLVCMGVLLDMTAANGKIKPTEFEILKGLAQRLEITNDQFKELMTKALEQLED